MTVNRIVYTLPHRATHIKEHAVRLIAMQLFLRLPEGVKEKLKESAKNQTPPMHMTQLVTKLIMEHVQKL